MLPFESFGDGISRWGRLLSSLSWNGLIIVLPAHQSERELSSCNPGEPEFIAWPCASEDLDASPEKEKGEPDTKERDNPSSVLKVGGLAGATGHSRALVISAYAALTWPDEPMTWPPSMEAVTGCALGGDLTWSSCSGDSENSKLFVNWPRACTM